MTTAPSPSFRDLDARARAGGPLTVVFFGCSLTWGANSTDPQEHSYRAHIARRLTQRYPAAQWRFVDAAIGGTDSRLGIFRFARDVARHQPDLVFVDFTLNDEPQLADPDHLASYEAIIRRCVGELRVPTVQVLLCAKDMVACLDLERFRTRTAHLAIATVYGCAVGDAFAHMQDLHRAGQLDLAAVWDTPTDACHPGDAGYRHYADAVWAGFIKAIDGDLVGRMPAQPRHAATYARTVRCRLTTLGLPSGWTAGKPSRIAAWYDSLMSRWLDDEAVGRSDAAGRAPAAWELRVCGATILLFGEATTTSGRLRVLIDGVPSALLADGILDCRSAFGGAVKLAVAVALGLDEAREHTVRLEPLADPVPRAAEWRIESVCAAGADPQVLSSVMH